MVLRQLTLRSVHREHAGRVSEPRKLVVVEADVVTATEGSIEVSTWPDTEIPPGSRSEACMHGGHPGTWETLVSPRMRAGGATGGTSPGPGRWLPLTWERNEKPNAVRPNEGNEVRSEGQQGVGAPHSSVETGTLGHKTLRSEGGAESWNCWEERWTGHRARKTSQRDSNG